MFFFLFRFTLGYFLITSWFCSLHLFHLIALSSERFAENIAKASSISLQIKLFDILCGYFVNDTKMMKTISLFKEDLYDYMDLIETGTHADKQLFLYHFNKQLKDEQVIFSEMAEYVRLGNETINDPVS